MSNEHLQMIERGGWWEIAGMIDFAETTIWLPEYQLMYVYELLDDPESMRAFLKAYDPDYINEDFSRMCMFLLLICRYDNGKFNAISDDWIYEGLEEAGFPEFGSFQEYQDWCFPPISWEE